MQYGMTPLMWAAMEGNEDVAKMLIDYNAEVDALTQVSIYTVRNPNPNPNRNPNPNPNPNAKY